MVKGEILITAYRNIEPGHEITYDYGKDYFNTFIKPHGCRCVKCREAKGKPTRRRKKASGASARNARRQAAAGAVRHLNPQDLTSALYCSSVTCSSHVTWVPSSDSCIAM